jgi:hypothetical protein
MYAIAKKLPKPPNPKIQTPNVSVAKFAPKRNRQFKKSLSLSDPLLRQARGQKKIES